MDNAATRRGAEGTRRLPNPRGQGERLREEIIEAASAILAESGPAPRLTLRGVAKQVGIAATSVYLHFPDVEHLAAAVAARRFPELTAAIVAAREGIADPAEAFRAGCRAYCRFALEHPGHYRVLFEASRPDLIPARPATGAWAAGRQAFDDTLVRDIERCREARVASADGDPRLVAVLVWSALHGLVTLRMSRPTFAWPPLDELVDEAVGRLVGMQHAPSIPPRAASGTPGRESLAEEGA